MKIGSTVIGLHVAALCAFSLTQGCVTSESQGSGRGPGAHHRGIVKHEHRGKARAMGTSVAQENPYGQYDSVDNGYMGVIDSGITTSEIIEEAPPAEVVQTSEIYIVQKGDILSQLAVDYDTTTASLIARNNLSNPDVLYVGQELSVPAGRKGAPKTTTKSGSVKKGGAYMIQKGDTLSGIAVAAGVSINDLRSLNGIKGDVIMAGELINIPSYGTVPSKTQKVTGTSSKSKAKSKAKETAPADQPEIAPADVPQIAPASNYDTPAFVPVEQPANTTMDVGLVEDKVVYPGETLDDIARQYGVSKAEIMRLNNISDESQVRPSQRLRIPIAE